MTGAQATADLLLCECEPIHIPGAIQPNGAMLVVHAESLCITHASANLQSILGCEPLLQLGQPLAVAIGAAQAQALAQLTDRDGTSLGLNGMQCVAQGGRVLHLQAHRTGHSICIDIEPYERPDPNASPITLARSILETFRQAESPQAMCELAVRGLRRTTGYDRVMAYRFAEDGHGEVIAEDCAGPLEPVLGLHYPASDIPAQARRHYLRQRVGTVADSAYVPVALLGDPECADRAPIDLTHSALRSVSPLHRQYMRNMGTAASLTVGLGGSEHLWGMFVCHHATPRMAGPDVRAVADIIGTVASLLLVSLGRAENEAARRERGEVLRQIIDRLAAPGTLHDAFATAQAELLDMVGATGALVCLGGVLRAHGRTPGLDQARRALATLQITGNGEIVAMDDLGFRFPALTPCVADGSGVLLLPLTPGTDDAILWFRPELERTILWGGDDTKATAGPPSPRTCFATRKQTITGRAAPWSQADLAIAGDLRVAVEAQVAQRARAELSALQNASQDFGQPNRQRELERSNAALEEFAYAASHDLKAPLRAIGHLAEWIAEDLAPAASPDTRENLGLLQGRVDRLQLLLDGLLTYSRAGREGGSVFEDIDIEDLVRGISADLAPPPGFVIICEAGLPPIFACRVPLAIVLTNLIANAVLHHDRAAGNIHVSMRLADGMAEFRVSDDGPGIPARFRERIFQIFQTLASRDHREASGVGLAIVRKHVLANGGTIRVENAGPRRGAVFVFTWTEAVR